MGTGRSRDLGRPRGALVSTLASSAVATAAVLGLVTGLVLVFGEQADPADAYADSLVQPAEPDLEAMSGPPRAGSTDGGRDDEPAAEDEAEPRVEAAEAEDEAEAEAEDGPAPPSVRVVVLNETRRKGLAAEFREVLADAGWRVGGVDDFRGNVPATTVYYPPGMRAEARALERQFDEVNRIRPAFPGIPTDSLTVILCKDYPTT